MEVNRCFGCMEENLTYPCPHCGYDPGKQKHQDYVLRPGTILHGKYLLGAKLGQGGFGITYIGWDLGLGRKVAIKEYFPSAYVTRHSSMGNNLQWYVSEQARTAQSSGLEIFLKEARKMTRVSKISQAVQVQELFQENETAYIVMDYIEGETLMQRLKRTGPLSWKQVKRLLLPVIDAMEQVHKAGLIHRDLSPDNLMLQSDGSVKILDLGAAKDLNINSGVSSMQVAKKGFSPLELYIQRGGSGTWTDVYSMAATMYYALTGILPPSAIDRIDRDSLRWDLPQLTSAVPDNVLRAMQEAMAIRPEERTKTMAEFAAGLQSRVKKPDPPSNNHLTEFALLIAAMALVLFVVVISAVGKNTSTSQTAISATEAPKITLEETTPAAVADTPSKQTEATQPKSTQATTPKGYISYVSGKWEQGHTINDGSSQYSCSAFVLSQTLRRCKEVTINMEVSMNAGTNCKSWQLWCRIDGKFQKAASITLPNGDGSTSQTVTFDDPITFDAIIVLPTIPGNYSWSMGLSVTDIWLAD